MSEIFEQRVNKLAAARPPDLLWGGLKGIEKESLRVRPDGYLSDRPHPEALGSALTNRFVTTDFSEALLEFVSPSFSNTWEALRFLCDIHQFSYEVMGDELLWPTSMPCRIPITTTGLKADFWNAIAAQNNRVEISIDPL